MMLGAPPGTLFRGRPKTEFENWPAFPLGGRGISPRSTFCSTRARIGAKPPGGAPLSLSPAERPETQNNASPMSPLRRLAGICQYPFLPAGTPRASPKGACRASPGRALGCLDHQSAQGCFDMGREAQSGPAMSADPGVEEGLGGAKKRARPANARERTHTRTYEHTNTRECPALTS